MCMDEQKSTGSSKLWIKTFQLQAKAKPICGLISVKLLEFKFRILLNNSLVKFTGWLKGNFPPPFNLIVIANISMQFMAMNLSDQGKFYSIMEFSKF